MFLASHRFRRDTGWRNFARPTLIWACVAVGAFLLVPALGDEYFGLAQRTFITTFVTWLLATAAYARWVVLGRPAEFPGGAVRGQLHAVSHAVDLNAFLRGGPLAAVLDGTQEVPAAGGPAVGDQDGHATSFVRPNGDKVEFSFTWNGIGAPTNGHLHAGAVGANGAVAVPLFAAPAGLPASVSGIAGTVPVKGDLSRQIRRHPADFYANLHTAEFPGGAVRGQLFASGGGDDDVFDQSSFVASPCSLRITS